MLINEREKLASILRTIGETLDISDHAYEDATLKYEDVGEHLASDDSDLRQYKPQIYHQGSFRLGTVVQPYARGDEYDIDLVCQLEIDKEGITQKDLKDRVGRRLRARADLAQIIEGSRRCWILDYPAESGMPRFHMDVLPSIPNPERRPTGILLTDTELTRWQKSNPIAYADWFRKRMDVVFRARRFALAESLKAAVEEVPDWRVKTPLQMSIQILKRHRDIYFQKNPEVRPVSIVLTTLAASAYENQEDIYDALISITQRMPSFIEYRSGKWWVQNPVDPDENFADKWNEYPERREAFIRWLKKVEADFAKVSNAQTSNEALVMLEEPLGQETVTRVAAALGEKREGQLPVVRPPLPSVPALGDARHAQAPQWPVVQRYQVRVSAGVHFKSKRDNRKGRLLWPLGDKPVSTKLWLRFFAKTDAPEPYSIRWQVVNTGHAAAQAGQPRGDFYEPNDPDKRVRWESTEYRGTHWVEAFVLREGVCVARSGKFYVKIR